MENTGCCTLRTSCVAAERMCEKAYVGRTGHDWEDFTITGDGSFSEYAFSLTVQSGENRICGELRDTDGTLFQLEATEIHPDDFRYLRSLYIGEFIEIKSDEQRNPHVNMNIHYLDGTPEEKEISEELAAEIYARFLPYFDINN